MSECRKCGLPLKFVRRNGKWWPANPDGSDHWDLCKRTQRKDMVYRPQKEALHKGKHTKFYEGSVPPWDESLGEFECYEGCCGGPPGFSREVRPASVPLSASWDGTGVPQATLKVINPFSSYPLFTLYGSSPTSQERVLRRKIKYRLRQLMGTLK